MHGYEQTMREYTIYKTFDKSKTDRIENHADDTLTFTAKLNIKAKSSFKKKKRNSFLENKCNEIKFEQQKIGNTTHI